MLFLDNKTDIIGTQLKDDLFNKAVRLKVMLTALATGQSCEESEYNELRRKLVDVVRVRSKLPGFVVNCHTLDEFWTVIKGLFGHYQERREYITKEFSPVLEMLELESVSPGDEAVTLALSTVDSEHVKAAWEKAMERRSADPEGAITSARTLLECVCKFVLEKNGVGYDDKMDLPTLYNRTADSLTIAPSQQTEQIMKQVLGGCQSVVSGLGALRNKISDAHGKGILAVTAKPQHAELAVNLAGAVALFMVSTWEEQFAESKNRRETF